MTKVCSKCKKEKDWSEFWKRKERNGRPRSRCISCSVSSNYKNIRRWHLRERYGITQEQYEAQLKKQDGKCAMCGTTEPKGRRNIFHIDHDPKTNKLRGLLCHKCNIGLGHYEKHKAAAEAYLANSVW